MEILGAAAIVAITGALIVWPLLRRDEQNMPGSPAQSSRDRARMIALAAVRELEFDYQTGKISTEDYTILRARYEAKAVETTAAPQAPPQRDLEADIEAQVAAIRAVRRCAACGETLPAAANFCPACGTVVGGTGS